MIFDYMRRRNPGNPVPDEKPERPQEYVYVNVGYRDSAREQVRTWWLPRTLRFIADCLEAE